MERTTTKHNARTDEALQHETESLTRGAPVEARIEESRMAEPAGEGEFEAKAVLHELREPIMGMPPDEVVARSEFAIALRPGAFPADAPSLLRVAEEDDAPEWVMETLRRVDQVQLYENVQRVWEAAGGHRELRTLPHDEPPPHTLPAEVADEMAEGPRQPSVRARRAANPAKRTPSEPRRLVETPAAPSPEESWSTPPVAAPDSDESYLGIALDFVLAGLKLSTRTVRVLTAPARAVMRRMPVIGHH